MQPLSLLALGIFFAFAQAQQEAKFVLLPERAASGVVATRGTWKPVKADLDTAEANVSQIASLKAENWPSSAIRIDRPERYFKQYVPIRQQGRNLLYVNAFCDAPTYWHTQLVIVSDGGTCFWQALYDPATERYSHLTINGRA
jgi:hypothetical protein